MRTLSWVTFNKTCVKQGRATMMIRSGQFLPYTQYTYTKRLFDKWPRFAIKSIKKIQGYFDFFQIFIYSQIHSSEIKMFCWMKYPLAKCHFKPTCHTQTNFGICNFFSLYEIPMYLLEKASKFKSISVCNNLLFPKSVKWILKN